MFFGWDIGFRKSSRYRSDDRDLSDDYLEYVIVENEEAELSYIEEKFRPIMKELVRMSKDLDIDIKEAKRRAKTLAMNADKIKGGVENEIGMRSIVGTLIKTKLDVIKERASIIKTAEDLKIKLANAGGKDAIANMNGPTTGAQTGKLLAMTHRRRDGKGVIDRSLFGEGLASGRRIESEPIDRYDTPSSSVPEEATNSGESARSTEPVIEKKETPNVFSPLDDDDIDIPYEGVGLVDYSYARQNLVASRQCTKDGETKVTKNVLFYDTGSSRFWPGVVDSEGNEIKAQEKPLGFVIKANIDLKSMRAEDPLGNIYSVIERSEDEMPSKYKAEWESLDI